MDVHSVPHRGCHGEGIMHGNMLGGVYGVVFVFLLYDLHLTCKE